MFACLAFGTIAFLAEMLIRRIELQRIDRHIMQLFSPPVRRLANVAHRPKRIPSE